MPRFFRRLLFFDVVESAEVVVRVAWRCLLSLLLLLLLLLFWFWFRF
jgi:hypothetical protein